MECCIIISSISWILLADWSCGSCAYNLGSLLILDHLLAYDQFLVRLIMMRDVQFLLCTWRSCNAGEGNVINCTWGILCRKGFQRPAGETGDIGQHSWWKIPLECMMGQHHHHSKHVFACVNIAQWCYSDLVLWLLASVVDPGEKLNGIQRYDMVWCWVL